MGLNHIANLFADLFRIIYLRQLKSVLFRFYAYQKRQAGYNTKKKYF